VAFEENSSSFPQKGGKKKSFKFGSEQKGEGGRQLRRGEVPSGASGKEKDQGEATLIKKNSANTLQTSEKKGTECSKGGEKKRSPLKKRWWKIPGERDFSFQVKEDTCNEKKKRIQAGGLKRGEGDAGKRKERRGGERWGEKRGGLYINLSLGMCVLVDVTQISEKKKKKRRRGVKEKKKGGRTAHRRREGERRNVSQACLIFHSPSLEKGNLRAQR